MNRNRLGMKYVFKVKYLSGNSFALLPNELITSFRNWCHLIIVHFDYLQLLRPNLKSFFNEVERLKKRRNKEKNAIQKLCLASIRTEACAASRTRTFMAPEYGSTFRRDAITSFSKSSAIVGSNFESRNLISLTRDWTTCDY